MCCASVEISCENVCDDKNEGTQVDAEAMSQNASWLMRMKYPS